jgi:two-component system sensor histidine kinase RegB
MPPRLTEPALALRWLQHARRGILGVQILVIGLAEVGTDLHLHSTALVALILGLAAVEVVESLWGRGRLVPAWAVFAHAAVDLVALTGILALSGGPRNPLVSAYLVYIALLGVVLSARPAWAATAATVAMHTLVVLHPGHLPGLEDEPLPAGHLVGHLVAFDLAAVAITWFVTRVSAALRDREASAREEQRQRATTDRLAALGTLAAGVAHELGTPLATIQLLAEEVAHAPDGADVRELLLQVERCRSILERLRSQEGAGPADCLPDLEAWTAEWSRAAPDVIVSLHGPPPARVAGAEGSWRGAVWTALDNARRAGARHVRIEVASEPDFDELRIDDDGAGLDPEQATRVGEPFRTTWGGTGLGLFVARSFAQSVRGDVVLEPGPIAGARVRIRMPRASE